MVIVILGPTGIGKTKLSIELAKKLNGEIINADSTQIFKGLDIATAKITEKEKEGIPHYLFDIRDISDNYTVYDYQKDCRNKIDEIIKKGKTPILVGGTGLYVSAALYDYQFNEEVNIENTSDKTNEELYNMLISIDPNTDIHPNNRKRVIRALTYFRNNHKPFSEKEKTNKLLYDAKFIGLTTDRDNLYEKINNRVDNMVNSGLLEEAKKIFDSNIRTKAVLTPIGYKELFNYFEKKCTLEESLDLIKQRSRHYAKRQYTWLNHQVPVEWIDVDFNNFDNTVNKAIYCVNQTNI